MLIHLFFNHFGRYRLTRQPKHVSLILTLAKASNIGPSLLQDGMWVSFILSVSFFFFSFETSLLTHHPSLFAYTTFITARFEGAKQGFLIIEFLLFCRNLQNVFFFFRRSFSSQSGKEERYTSGPVVLGDIDIDVNVMGFNFSTTFMLRISLRYKILSYYGSMEHGVWTTTKELRLWIVEPIFIYSKNKKKKKKHQQKYQGFTAPSPIFFFPWLIKNQT